jgi:ABC-type multidrug transport system ATPase subunit
VRAGHTKIFLGASGAGKSTILKLLLGLLKPDAGPSGCSASASTDARGS